MLHGQHKRLVNGLRAAITRVRKIMMKVTHLRDVSNDRVIQNDKARIINTVVIVMMMMMMKVNCPSHLHHLLRILRTVIVIVIAHIIAQVLIATMTLTAPQAHLILVTKDIK